MRSPSVEIASWRRHHSLGRRERVGRLAQYHRLGKWLSRQQQCRRRQRVLRVDEQGAVLFDFLRIKRPYRDHAQLRQGGQRRAHPAASRARTLQRPALDRRGSTAPASHRTRKTLEVLRRSTRGEQHREAAISGQRMPATEGRAPCQARSVRRRPSMACACELRPSRDARRSKHRSAGRAPHRPHADRQAGRRYRRR